MFTYVGRLQTQLTSRVEEEVEEEEKGGEEERGQEKAAHHQTPSPERPIVRAVERGES